MESLISFTNSSDKLLVQIPVLLKCVSQVPISFYSIHTLSVPIYADVQYPYILMSPDSYIPLMELQRKMCTCMGDIIVKMPIC